MAIGGIRPRLPARSLKLGEIRSLAIRHIGSLQGLIWNHSELACPALRGTLRAVAPPGSGRNEQWSRSGRIAQLRLGEPALPAVRDRTNCELSPKGFL